MDLERALISRVVRTQTLEVALVGGVEPEHFIGKAVGEGRERIPASSEVWQWMKDHYRHYRAIPSLDLFARRWPTYPLLDVSDPLEAILDDFVRVVKRREAINKLRDLGDIVDDWDKVGDAEAHFYAAARELARLVPTSQVTRYSDSPNRLELHKMRQALGKIPGIPLGLPQIDDITYGMQSYEMAIIEGFLGTGKSTLAIMISALNYFSDGRSSLWFSLEMEGDKLASKWDSYAAKISYNAMKRMELRDEDYEAWAHIAEAAHDSRFEKDMYVIDNVNRPSVDRIFAEVERWRPDFTVVDTIDEVSAPASERTLYERQSFAARELKGIARQTKRPLIACAQAGRDAEHEGAKLGNIAGAIDIGRKADMVVGLHATDDMFKIKKMDVSLLKYRDGEGRGVTFPYYWDVPNLDIRPWEMSDAVPAR